MRLYRIINNDTGKTLDRIAYVPRRKSKNHTVAGHYELEWGNPDTELWFNIRDINALIKETIRIKLQSEIRNCRIESVERKYIPIKSGVKLETIVNRHERDYLATLLKG